MKKLRLLLFVILFSIHLPTQAQISIDKAFCENKVNPTGINCQDIRFSWQLKSPKNGEAQQAFQLVVASSAANLRKGRFDIYDSGRHPGTQSIQVQYPGKSLEAAHKYYWKVRVWDASGKVSAWSESQHFTTGLFTEKDWNNAQWIGYEDLDDSLRVVPFIHAGQQISKPVYNPASPLLRKEFHTGKKIKSAYLFISGLGHYQAFLNGFRVGNSFLAPGWTDYDKTVLYNSYDVTTMVQEGKNTLGAVLGNGFYNISQERYYKCTGIFGKPKMISSLKITYTDGSTENIISDNSWKTSLSPIIYNNIYGGEDYDARLEQKGWSTNTFNDNHWKNAVTVQKPSGQLLPEIDNPVAIMDSLTVKEAWEAMPGTIVYDFGQNISGVARIKVRGKAGQSIKLIPAEFITDHKTVVQSNAAPHYYTYILKGGASETWTPEFTYYAVRYMQVEGVISDTVKNRSGFPVIEKIDLLHNRNSSPVNGSFSCSNDLFNRIYTLIDQAIKSNIQSVITDNPQREKLSWQGEQNFMRTSVNYCYDVYNLYRSLVQNMIDAQHINGVVPDIAPEFVKFEGPFVDSPEWGTTSILDLWFLYKYYGDTATIKKAYPMMIKYAGHLESKAQDNILHHGLNDWLDVGPNHKSPANLTPQGITATVYYYKAIRALGEMAYLMGNTKDGEYYKQLAGKIRDSFNATFFDQETKVYGNGSQTSMAMPLSAGMVDEIYQKPVLRNLVNSIKANGTMNTTGDVGHRFLVDALYRNGQEQLLFDMTSRDDVPGYAYQLKKGITALSETWEGNLSNNQLAMGHIFEWFYGGIAGISQEENSVAFKHIRIQPQPVGDLAWAKGSFHSPYGWIRTDWKKETGSFTLKVEIPVNTKATLYIPVSETARINCNGVPVSGAKRENNLAIFEVGSGQYDIRVVK